MNIAPMIALCLTLMCGCQGTPDPPTPSDAIVVPYQITMEYKIEADDQGNVVALARYYDALQVLDWAGNAGTLELTGGDAAFVNGVELSDVTHHVLGSTLRVEYSQMIEPADEYLFELRRPNNKGTFKTRLPSPTPLTMTFSESGNSLGQINWEPKVGDSTVNILLSTEQRGCLL